MAQQLLISTSMSFQVRFYFHSNKRKYLNGIIDFPQFQSQMDEQLFFKTVKKEVIYGKQTSIA